MEGYGLKRADSGGVLWKKFIFFIDGFSISQQKIVMFKNHVFDGKYM